MVLRGLIVGVDEGTTAAVAVLDLRGGFLGLRSGKNFSKGEQQLYIQSFGQPLLFASDVSKVPQTLQKLAASFGCLIVAPQKDLGRQEKSETVSVFLNLERSKSREEALLLKRKYKRTTENFHEVSALAAAIFCYNRYENKFRQIERQLAERGALERVEEIKRKAVQGVSVNRALEGRP